MKMQDPGLNMHTLSRAELLDAGHLAEETSHIFLGGYPELHLRTEADLWFSAYVATHLERDVRNILRVVDLKNFNRTPRQKRRSRSSCFG